MTWLEREFWSSPVRPGTTAARSVDGSVASAVAVPPPGAARFERQGPDLVLVVPISRTEALNGALVMVPVPGKDVRLRVPPGTATGRRFRIPRVSAPAPDGFGDLTVVVEVS